jgi:hypothetical protein
MHHVERIAGGHAEALALADRVMNDAGMLAEHPPVNMDDVAGQRRIRLELGDHIGVFALRHETDVLAVGLVGDDQAHFLGQFPGPDLRQFAERKADIIELVLRGGEQEIALVAIGIDRPVERPRPGLPGDGLARERI